MGKSQVCSTEDAVHALLDYLVEPLLPPAESTKQRTPSESRQLSVAKQMHAVVLLYNYYHRKRHLQLEHLGFEQFCKLAVVLKPNLMAHMNLMKSYNDAELSTLDKQLSPVEKEIMEACDISMCLDALTDVPMMKEWPISKVSVLLVDSRKENCFMKFGSITKGVWSIIEKDVSLSSHSPEGNLEATHTNKRKRVTKRPLTDQVGDDKIGFQKVAFLAVEETIGISQNDLTIIESHIVYSMSKEKTATCFYIMQCTQPSFNRVIEMPILDAIDRLQGPLIRKSSDQWITTSVVEYFHVLPYAQVIRECFLRKVFVDNLQDQSSGERERERELDLNSSERGERQCDLESHTDGDGYRCQINSGIVEAAETGASIESTTQNVNYRHCTNGFSDVISSPHNMDVDDSTGVHWECKATIKDINCRVELNPHQIVNTCKESDLSVTNEGAKAVVVKLTTPCTPGCRGEDGISGEVAPGNVFSSQHLVPVGNDSQSVNRSDSKDSAKIQKTIASKENILSKTALRVLHSKRDELVLNQRLIEDKIAQYDKKIQTIMTGGDDDLELKIDSIVEGCDNIKREHLSEEVVEMPSPCWELDDMCYKNNWRLPTYRVSALDGGFQASITLREMDFQLTSEGDVHSTTPEARESAARQILAKLCNVASLAH
ncbi:hypothetical protein SLA2020_313040 [Shorea laevis]